MVRKSKWIKDSIKRPGALRKKLGAESTKGPRGGKVKHPIPAGKVAATITRLQAKSKGPKKLSAPDLRLLQQALLAKKLKAMPHRRKKK